MGKRRGYHHGNLSAALVAAALEVIDERGPEGLSVREVARRAGVSSGAPFRHFADKNALLAAVAEDALTRFLESTERAARDAGEDPLDRFQSTGIAFVRFAVEHPAHFRVMFRPELIALESDRARALRKRTRAIFRGLVVDAQASGQIRSGEPEPIMLAAYAICYGLARIYVDGLRAVVGVPDVDPESIAELVTAQLGRGIEAPPR